MCIAIPRKIVSIDVDEFLGLRRSQVAFDDGLQQVSLDYTPEARIGDYVLVHAGFALSVMDDQEAEQVFAAVRELDQIEA